MLVTSLHLLGPAHKAKARAVMPLWPGRAAIWRWGPGRLRLPLRPSLRLQRYGALTPACAAILMPQGAPPTLMAL